MRCPICGGRIYEATDIFQCQDCGYRDLKSRFYEEVYAKAVPSLMLVIECGECGVAKSSLSVGDGVCSKCGGRVDVKTADIPIGCAMVAEEREGKVPEK